MARTREFDYERILDKATRVFWKSGYSGASLRTLLASMGIGEGSFYNTLKSKKHLYIECLKHYNATIGRERAAAFLSAPTASLGIRALFGSVLDCLDNPQTPSRVCLMAASLSGDVLAEPELRKVIQDEMSALTDLLAGRLAADQDAGKLPVDFDPKIVTPIIVTYLQGLWRMALMSYDRPRVERQIDLLLTGLGL